MSYERKFILDTCNGMKEGQSVRVSRRLFCIAYPCGWPSIYETSEQAFLSSMIGSSWGIWRVRQELDSGDIIISKHHESNKRYYIDPDREYLFKRMPDGTLELKDYEHNTHITNERFRNQKGHKRLSP